MRRRAFIGLLGGAAAWPLAARSQQAIPVIGFFSGRSPEEASEMLAAFRQGLSQGGFVEGRNVKIDYRWAEGRYDRLPAMAEDLVRQQVSLIFAAGPPLALAAKRATSTTPILFNTGEDPVKMRLVDSFHRPGGNATGVFFLSVDLGQKQVGLLRELLPQVGLVGCLVNPNSSNAEGYVQEVQRAGRTLGIEVLVFRATKKSDFEPQFSSMRAHGIAALTIVADPFFTGHRQQLTGLAAQLRLIAIYPFRDYVLAGGLLSYGASLYEAYRQNGLYAARILKGELPSNLPVIQPTKFELVINLKTANTLGLDIPPTLLARADEVIE